MLSPPAPLFKETAQNTLLTDRAQQDESISDNFPLCVLLSLHVEPLVVITGVNGATTSPFLYLAIYPLGLEIAQQLLPSHTRKLLN